MEHRHREEGGIRASRLPRRATGLLRRRRHNECTVGQQAPSYIVGQDAFGERNTICEHDEEKGRLFGVGGREGELASSTRTSAREGKDLSSSGRPRLLLLVQGVLSFVGMVVLPSQLAYKVLVQPPRSAGPASPFLHRGGFVTLDLGNMPSRDVAAGSSIKLTSAGEASQGGGVVSDKGSTGESVGWGTSRRGRILQSANDDGDSFTYTTLTQFQLCVSSDLNVTEESLASGIRSLFGIPEAQDEGSEVSVEETAAEFCDDGQELNVKVVNEPTTDRSAAAVSADQIELVRSPTFTENLSSEMDGMILATDISYTNLGYIVLYDEVQVETAAGGLGDDFVSFVGPDQWWPWWAWLLLGLLFLVGIIPLAACAYCYASRRSEPPSPSGAGGGPGTFGRGRGSGKGGKGDDDIDWESKQFEKPGGYSYADKDDDAATGISTDSPLGPVNASSFHVRDVSVADSVASGPAAPDDWPEAMMESGDVPAGPSFSSQGADSAAKSQHGDEGSVLSEADRAAGVDPGRQLEQDGTSGPSANPLVTSASFNPTEGGVSLRPSMDATRESTNASFQGSVPQDGAPSADDGHGLLFGGNSGAIGEGAAALGAGALASGGPSGRSIGDAAAALREEDQGDFNDGDLHPALATTKGQGSDDTAAGAGEETEAEAEANAAAGLPPSGRTSVDPKRSSRESSSSTGTGSKYPGYPGVPRSRAGSGSSTSGGVVEEFRHMTDEQRQVAMRESESARAASYLRGTTSKVPLQPDLERALTEEEQERRRRAVQEVEASRRPSVGAPGVEVAADEATAAGPSSAGTSPPTSLMGKVAAGMNRFFGMDSGSRSPSTMPTAAAVSPTATKGESAVEEGFDAGSAATAGAALALGMSAAQEKAGPGDAAVVGAEGTGRAVPPTETEAGGFAPVARAQEDVAPQGEVQAEARVAAGVGLQGEGSLSPEQVLAYSDNVDRTLEKLPEDDGAPSQPLSEILARADLEAKLERDVVPAGAAVSSGVPATAAAVTSSSVPPSSAPPAGSRVVGLPPTRPGQAAAAVPMQQPQSDAASADVSRLIRIAEESGISLDEPDASLPSPIVATPPALLRPGVGAARGAASRGRGLLQRNSASGSLVSSRSTSVTEDLISNNLTEDDMSSDAHTTDVSRTSSYIATGSSFEESLAQSQAASGRFLSSGALGSGAPASSAAAGIPAPGDGNLSSLAERLARAEETVSRDHEKGLLYRQGPEGVAAVVAGEELPLPSAAAAASRGAGAGPSRGGEMKVESLADLLARADGGPGNLKEEFRMLDEMEAKRLEDLNAAASAEGADDETKARWRGSLAEWMVKVDRDGNLREFLGLPTTVSDTSSASDGHVGRVVDEADSAPGSASQSQAASSASASHQARPE